MQSRNFVIVDDLDPVPVVKLIARNYQGAQWSRVTDGEEMKSRLSRNPGETVILLNAHVKFRRPDFRSNFIGMRFLRKELRTTWERLEPVIVYSPLPEEAFINVPTNRILCASIGHYYWQVIEPERLHQIIAQARPIPSKGKLKEIIERYGGIGNLICKFKHDMENKLPVRVSEAIKTDNIDSFEQVTCLANDLRNLIPERLHESFQSTRLVAEAGMLLDSAGRKDTADLAKHINRIQTILSSYNELCSQHFSFVC
jgi:hypothetical protein